LCQEGEAKTDDVTKAGENKGRGRKKVWLYEEEIG